MSILSKTAITIGVIVASTAIYNAVNPEEAKSANEVYAAQSSCQKAVVKMAKHVADPDFLPSSDVYKIEGGYRLIGKDVKMQNGFGAWSYPDYMGEYRNGSCTILSITKS